MEYSIASVHLDVQFVARTSLSIRRLPAALLPAAPSLVCALRSDVERWLNRTLTLAEGTTGSGRYRGSLRAASLTLLPVSTPPSPPLPTLTVLLFFCLFFFVTVVFGSCRSRRLSRSMHFCMRAYEVFRSLRVVSRRQVYLLL